MQLKYKLIPSWNNANENMVLKKILVWLCGPRDVKNW